MVTELNINVDQMIEFLVGLLNTPSPTGYHVEAINYAQQAFEALAIAGTQFTITRKGSLLIRLPGLAADAPIALTAHVDTLGFMVKEIKSSGRLALTSLGGILWPAVESEGVTIRTHEDRRIRGSIVAENTSVHVNNKIATTERKADTMEVRLDEITRSSQDTRDLGIQVGDFVFVDPRVEVSDSGFIRSRFLDDKASVACIYGALLAIKEAGLRLPQDVYILIANYEEVGHGGAADFPADLIELLAVDMGAIGKGQSGDEYSVSICVKDAGGPYHLEMNNKLRRLAEAHDIPHNVDIYVNYASDGTSYWGAGGSARVGLTGPGVDGSHAYERTHKDSLQHTAHLLARYMLDEG